MAIFVAAILDGVDGRVARMTNTQSEFGVQYDSLADLVSFGMAPALVMYYWALSTYRLDGITIDEVAREFGVSRSTVEKDLQKAYRALLALRSRDDA